MIVAPVCVKLRRWGWLWIYVVMVTVFHRLGVETWVGRRRKGCGGVHLALHRPSIRRSCVGPLGFARPRPLTSLTKGACSRQSNIWMTTNGSAQRRNGRELIGNYGVGLGIGRRLPSKRNLRHMNQCTRHIDEPVWRTLRPIEIAQARPR